MSELNEFNQFSFSNYDDINSNNVENKTSQNNGEYEINEELGSPNSLSDNLDRSNNLTYNDLNISLNSVYNDININKREIEESSNNLKHKSSSNNMNDSLNKYSASLRKESRIMSFENSYEQFFEKESDISDTEESTTWETERLKRIEERKEYEKKKKMEIKKKAAEDLKKWYEEMAIIIEEKKKQSKKKKSEEKRKEENLENKTWLKVSQYLDLEKGEYFKENSRMKQVLLKLIKKEGS
ncbi:clathrin light chain [Plasmodium brasilianum]|uniref:Clathrin light chain n=2 Tax=Plasmodium (Plasmodium) TaxID=418103 RepID=A0A1A8WBI2_PLAMA|nr:conserved Plasmodium protein, unknown function [Plasmodium malariae]KAI4835672.1 clathrin light chain [Plasmodium brasilianum]SBS89361.1 hypothetical protein PMALA_025810 [Plasmodium malariae]SCP02601.1 conserved Plasmodium protein, unknown function [Plasmodium malariae]